VDTGNPPDGWAPQLVLWIQDDDTPLNDEKFYLRPGRKIFTPLEGD
jgi:hypothetical protein